jgi:hypothetical protein
MTFSPAQTILTYDSCLGTRGYLAADGDNAYITCIVPSLQTPFYASAIIRSSDNGATWSSPRILYGGRLPTLISAQGPDVYLQLIGVGNSRVTLRSGSYGERWDTLRNFQPALTEIAPAGEFLHAVGVAELGNRREVVYYISGLRGTFWYGPELISREDLAPSTLPSICVNEKGNPVITWNDTGTIKMRRSLNQGLSWAGEMTVSEEKGAVLTDVASSQSYIGVAWDNDFSDSGGIRLRTSNTFARDLCRTEYPTNATHVGEPSVEADGNRLYLVWSESENGFSRIRYRNAALPIDPDLLPPERFDLGSNYPNPFNGTTTFSYDVAVPGNVRIRLYNMLGQEVRVLVDSYLPAGRYSCTLAADELPTGAYLYQLSGPGFSGSRRLLLVR